MEPNQSNNPSQQVANLAVRMPDFGRLFQLIQENTSLRLDQLLHRYCVGCYDNSPVQINEGIRVGYMRLKSEVLGIYKNTLDAQFDSSNLSGDLSTTPEGSNELRSIHKSMQGMLQSGEPLLNILQSQEMWHLGAIAFQPDGKSWTDLLTIEPGLLKDPVSKSSSQNLDRMQRVYVSCNPECVPRLILEVLSNESLSGKIRYIKTIDFSLENSSKVSSTRSDRLVFYVEPLTVDEVNNFFIQFSHRQADFQPGNAPCFTKQLSPGVSIGQEPKQNEGSGLAKSFITSRKDLLLNVCTRVALEICRSCDESEKSNLDSIIDAKITELNPGEEEDVQEDIQIIREEVSKYILSGTRTNDSEMVLRSALPEILKLTSAQNLPAEKLNTFISEEATKLGIDPNNLHLNLAK